MKKKIESRLAPNELLDYQELESRHQESLTICSSACKLL